MMTSTDSANWRSVATTYTTSQTPPAQSSTKNRFCGHRFISLRNANFWDPYSATTSEAPATGQR